MNFLKRLFGFGGAVESQGCGSFSTHYEVKEVLGKGSFATVHRVVEINGGEEYAVKICRMGSLSHTERVNLDEEVSLLRRCNHQAIVHLKETFFTPAPPEDTLRVVTEIIRGGDLFDELADTDYDTAPYSELSARSVVGGILDAVEYLHERGVVHRDIKPENIMLCRPRAGASSTQQNFLHVKLVDFGIAGELTHGATRLHGRFGTPLYMAPEIVRGDAAGYDEKVDVWSLGVLVYLLIVGEPPLAKAAMEPPSPGQQQAIFDDIVAFRRVAFTPVDSWARVSDECQDLIAAMLTVDAGDRLSAHDLRHHAWFSSAGEHHESPARLASRSSSGSGSARSSGGGKGVGKGAGKGRNHARFATLRADTLRADSAKQMGTLRFGGSATLRASSDTLRDDSVARGAAPSSAGLRASSACGLSHTERNSARAKRDMLVTLSHEFRSLRVDRGTRCDDGCDGEHRGCVLGQALRPANRPAHRLPDARHADDADLETHAGRRATASRRRRADGEQGRRGVVFARRRRATQRLRHPPRARAQRARAIPVRRVAPHKGRHCCARVFTGARPRAGGGVGEGEGETSAVVVGEEREEAKSADVRSEVCALVGREGGGEAEAEAEAAEEVRAARGASTRFTVLVVY